MKYSVALASLVCVVALAAMGAEAMPPIQCNPRFVDEVSLRIRKVCKLLNTIEEFNSAMETYANRQETWDSFTAQPLISFLNDQEDEIPDGVEGLPLLDSGVKRQDVDHVFLRFGRKKR